jgi:hypothetical protein
VRFTARRVCEGNLDKLREANDTAAIEYIHMNPVRRGLVKRAVDWKWSSASWYWLDPPRQQRQGLPFIHGLPTGTLDR